MAVGAATGSSQDYYLLNVVRPYVHDMLPHQTLCLKYFEGRKETLSEGRKIQAAFQTGMPPGPQSTRNDQRPVAGYADGILGEENYVNQSQGLSVSDSLFIKMGDRKASLEDPWANQIRAFMTVWKQTFDFRLYRDGTGLVSYIKSGDSPTTFTVDGPIRDAAMKPQIKGIFKGSIYSILQTADGTPGAAGVAQFQVTGIDRNTGQITIANVAGQTLPDFALLTSLSNNYALYAHNSYGTCVLGLAAAIHDSNTYWGINRSLSANEALRATVHRHPTAPGTPRAWAPELLADLLTDMDLLEKDTAGANIMILTSPRLWDSIVRQYTGDMRWFNDGKPIKIDGWADAVMFKGLPMVRAPKMFDNEQFVVDWNAFKLLQHDEGYWAGQEVRGKGPGAVTTLWLQDPDAYRYKTYWKWHGQGFCEDPAKNGALVDLKP